MNWQKYYFFVTLLLALAFSSNVVHSQEETSSATGAEESVVQPPGEDAASADTADAETPSAANTEDVNPPVVGQSLFPGLGLGIGQGLPSGALNPFQWMFPALNSLLLWGNRFPTGTLLGQPLDETPAASKVVLVLAEDRDSSLTPMIVSAPSAENQQILRQTRQSSPLFTQIVEQMGQFDFSQFAQNMGQNMGPTVGQAAPGDSQQGIGQNLAQLLNQQNIAQMLSQDPLLSQQNLGQGLGQILNQQSLVQLLNQPNSGQGLGQFPNIGQLQQQISQLNLGQFANLAQMGRTQGNSAPQVGAPNDPTAEVVLEGDEQDPAPAPETEPEPAPAPPPPPAPQPGQTGFQFPTSVRGAIDSGSVMLGQALAQATPPSSFFNNFRPFQPWPQPMSAVESNPIDAQASEVSEVRVKPDQTSSQIMSNPSEKMAQIKISAAIQEALRKKNIPILWFRMPEQPQTYRDAMTERQLNAPKTAEDLQIESKLQAFERQVISELKQLQEIERQAKEMRAAAKGISAKSYKEVPYKLSYALSKTPIHKITREDIEKVLSDEYVKKLLQKSTQRQAKEISKGEHIENYSKHMSTISGMPFKRQTMPADTTSPLQHMSKDEIVRMLAYAYRLASDTGKEMPGSLDDAKKQNESKMYDAFRAASEVSKNEDVSQFRKNEKPNHSHSQQSHQEPTMPEQRQMKQMEIQSAFREGSEDSKNQEESESKGNEKKTGKTQWKPSQLLHLPQQPQQEPTMPAHRQMATIEQMQRQASFREDSENPNKQDKSQPQGDVKEQILVIQKHKLNPNVLKSEITTFDRQRADGEKEHPIPEQRQWIEQQSHALLLKQQMPMQRQWADEKLKQHLESDQRQWFEQQQHMAQAPVQQMPMQRQWADEKLKEHPMPEQQHAQAPMQHIPTQRQWIEQQQQIAKAQMQQAALHRQWAEEKLNSEQRHWAEQQQQMAQGQMQQIPLQRQWADEKLTEQPKPEQLQWIEQQPHSQSHAPMQQILMQRQWAEQQQQMAQVPMQPAPMHREWTDMKKPIPEQREANDDKIKSEQQKQWSELVRIKELEWAAVQQQQQQPKEFPEKKRQWIDAQSVTPPPPPQHPTAQFRQWAEHLQQPEMQQQAPKTKETPNPDQRMMQHNPADLQELVGAAGPQMPENAGNARHKERIFGDFDLLGLGGNGKKVKGKKVKDNYPPSTIINYYYQQGYPSYGESAYGGGGYEMSGYGGGGSSYGGGGSSYSGGGSSYGGGASSYGGGGSSYGGGGSSYGGGGSSYGGGGYGSNAYGSNGGGYRTAVGNDEIESMLRQDQTMRKITPIDADPLVLQDAQQAAQTINETPNEQHSKFIQATFRNKHQQHATLFPDHNISTARLANRLRLNNILSNIDKCSVVNHVRHKRNSKQYSTLQTIDEKSLSDLRTTYKDSLKEITLNPDEDPAEALMRHNAAAIREALERANKEPMEISGGEPIGTDSASNYYENAHMHIDSRELTGEAAEEESSKVDRTVDYNSQYGSHQHAAVRHQHSLNSQNQLNAETDSIGSQTYHTRTQPDTHSHLNSHSYTNLYSHPNIYAHPNSHSLPNTFTHRNSHSQQQQHHHPSAYYADMEALPFGGYSPYEISAQSHKSPHMHVAHHPAVSTASVFNSADFVTAAPPAGSTHSSHTARKYLEEYLKTDISEATFASLLEVIKQRFISCCEKCKDRILSDITEHASKEQTEKYSKSAEKASYISDADHKKWLNKMAAKGYDRKFLTKAHQWEYMHSGKLDLAIYSDEDYAEGEQVHYGGSEQAYSENSNAQSYKRNVPQRLPEFGDNSGKNAVTKESVNQLRRTAAGLRSKGKAFEMTNITAPALKDHVQKVNAELKDSLELPEEEKTTTMNPYAMRGKFARRKVQYIESTELPNSNHYSATVDYPMKTTDVFEEAVVKEGMEKKAKVTELLHYLLDLNDDSKVTKAALSSTTQAIKTEKIPESSTTKRITTTTTATTTAKPTKSKRLRTRRRKSRVSSTRKRSSEKVLANRSSKRRSIDYNLG